MRCVAVAQGEVEIDPWSQWNSISASPRGVNGEIGVSLFKEDGPVLDF
jgi:hypothetical protein